MTALMKVMNFSVVGNQGFAMTFLLNKQFVRALVAAGAYPGSLHLLSIAAKQTRPHTQWLQQSFILNYVSVGCLGCD